MSKNLTSVILVLLIMTLGCANCIPGWMDAKKSTDQLMTVLRDGDYARTLELMDNDGSKPSAKRIEELKKEIESDNLQPQSWTLEEEYHGKSGAKPATR